MTEGGPWATVRVLGAREVRSRLLDRGFLVATALNVLVLVGLIVGPALVNDPTPVRVAFAGRDAHLVARELAAAPGMRSVSVQVTTRPRATAGVRSGRFDVAVLDARTFLVMDRVPARASEALEHAVRAAMIRERLRAAGISAEAASQIVAAPPPTVSRIAGAPLPDPSAERIATVSVFLLFGQLMSYTYWVATGVVEEKSTHVADLLLARVRPWQLMASKVLGIGVLGLAHLALLAVVALSAALAVGSVSAPAAMAGPCLVVAGCFLLGYVFYSCLFAAAAATVSRQEELPNVTAPLQLLMLASVVVAIRALGDQGMLTQVASLLPPTAPLVLAPRIVGTTVSWWTVAASVGLLLGTTALLLPAAARLYQGAILRSGPRVRLRDVWAAERRRPPSTR